MRQASNEIGRNRLLGIKYFSRIRLKETTLNLDSSISPIKYPSLAIFSRNIDLPKGISSLIQVETWKEISSSLFLLSLFNLMLSRKIEIYTFKDVRIYFGMIKLKYESVGFKLIDESACEDLMEELILNAIKRNDAYVKSQQDAKRILVEVVSDCIGDGFINYPEKKFVSEVLKLNSLKFYWFRIKTTPSVLGLVDDSNLTIEQSEKVKLLGDFSHLKEQYRSTLKSQKSWQFFHDELRMLVRDEFIRRYPRRNSVI
jgi:hypothetical protein